MKSFAISALALMALSLAPTLSQADGYRQADGQGQAGNTGPGGSEPGYGQHGYEQRAQHMDLMRKQVDAVHSARTEILDRADACLERAATADATKACIRAERAETKALHTRMKAQMAERMQARAEKHSGRRGAGQPDSPARM